jgi:putative ABC transport system ATP-binding protein
VFKFRAKTKKNGLSVVEADGYRHGNTHLIDLRSVSKSYATAAGDFTALRQIDLLVDRGEFVAVVGKSGSGKSTLINMITGIDRPSAGQVLIGDTAVHTLSEGQMAVWRGKHVGVIFQFFQLLPTLTILENVMLPMDFCNTYPGRERASRAMALLDEVEMTEHADKLPSATSGGQQQRVAIARALANDPDIIVADEPTGNLDSKTADAVFELFQRLVDEGKTILMVTHDDELAHRAGRTVTIADGLIVGDTGRSNGQRSIVNGQLSMAHGRGGLTDLGAPTLVEAAAAGSNEDGTGPSDPR